MPKNIEFLVRAIIIINDKFLVCRKKNKDYYFFPGGHVEFNETAIDALKREIMEELGLEIKKAVLMGGSEHFFIEDCVERHEINISYYVKLKKEKIESQESHLDFFLFSKDKLLKEKVYPESMKKNVLKWIKDKKLFWGNI
jgi:8-oxo-dGTP diphosphatase